MTQNNAITGALENDSVHFIKHIFDKGFHVHNRISFKKNEL